MVKGWAHLQIPFRKKSKLENKSTIEFYSNGKGSLYMVITMLPSELEARMKMALYSIFCVKLKDVLGSFQCRK